MPGVATSLHALARNRDLTRVGAAWLLFVLSEYAVWIGMLVYAYAQGGATTAGVVAVAQLVPGVVLAAAADRGSPVPVLVGGYVAQGLGMGLTAAILYADGPPIVAYAGAVFASTAVASTRPAQAAITPALARSAEELMATNTVLGWLENAGIMIAGALTGLALSTDEPGVLFAAGAGAAYVAAAVLATLHVAGLAAEPDESDDGSGAGIVATTFEGVRSLRSHAQARLIVAIVTAEYIVIGALDLMFVILAVSVLHRGPEWSGYLNTSYGVGGVAATAVTAALLGRRLSKPLFVAGLVLAAALAVSAFSRDAYLTAVLLAVAGLGRAVLDTAAHTLLQRTVPPDLLGRVFGIVESLTGAGLALGSLLVPLLVGLGGAKAALLGTAALIPLVLAFGARSLTSLDAAARVPIVEIALLRSMPHFRSLPTPELEGLAGAVEHVTVADGQTIMRQGEPGDRFYAIAEGRVAVSVDGRHVATRTRPEGLGEIALIRRIPRTATVVADGPVVLYGLDGELFTTIVTGHAATGRRVDTVAEQRLAADAHGASGR